MQPMHVITRLLLHANTPRTPAGTHMCQENFPAGVGRCQAGWSYTHTDPHASGDTQTPRMDTHTAIPHMPHALAASHKCKAQMSAGVMTVFGRVRRVYQGVLAGGISKCAMDQSSTKRGAGGGSMVGSDRLNVPAIDNSSH